jgi:hypothetical protein
MSGRSIILSLLATTPVVAEITPTPRIPPRYELLADPYFSPYSGGEDLLFATRLLERTEQYLLKNTTLLISKKPKARSWRLTELLTVWWPLNYEAMLIQHEVFGHGFRIRSLGPSVAKVSGYQLNAPPPYSYGGGATAYRFYPDAMTPMDESAISSAGIESTAILANLTKFKWIAPQKKIDPRQALLYLYSQHDITFYIGSLKTHSKDGEPGSTGHDIHDYLFWLNRTYPNAHLSKHRLQNYSLVNYLDPFTYYAIWSCFCFIDSGKKTRIPMIPIGKLGYLPSFRLGLTPFGPEFFFENYFAKDNSMYYGYIKAGNHASNPYLGVGAYAPLLWQIDGLEIGLRLDVWHQPKLMNTSQIEVTEWFDDPANTSATPFWQSSSKYFGGALSATFAYRWKEFLGLEAEFGAKSKGFLPGYPLAGSPTLRGGIYTEF